MPLSHSFTLSW